MKSLVISALSLAACAVSLSSASAAGSRVIVEVACVVRTQEKPGDTTLKEELSAALNASKEATKGLDPFFREWLAGQDRSRFMINCVRVKAPLGAEIEVQTERSEGDDPEGEVANPGIPSPKLMGLLFEMKTKEAEEGRIELECQFRKSTPVKELSVTGPGGTPIYGMRTLMMSPRIKLEPKVPQVVGPLISEKREKDKTQINEFVMIFRVVPDPG